MLVASRLYEREDSNMANRSRFRHTVLIGWFRKNVTDGGWLCDCCRRLYHRKDNNLANRNRFRHTILIGD